MKAEHHSIGGPGTEQLLPVLQSAGQVEEAARTALPDGRVLYMAQRNQRLHTPFIDDMLIVIR